LIVYLMTRLARQTVGPSLPYFPDDLRHSIRLWSYGSVLKMRELPVATYIFSDVERMAPQAKVLAARIWMALERSGRPVRLVNHPIRCMRRPELLRSLYERGINDFNAYSAQRLPAEPRFPVFLRSAHDHLGPRSDLIHDGATLDAEIARLEADGMPRRECLVVEFCDTRDANGVYRKFDALIADGTIVPTDMYFSSRWVVKWQSNRIFDGQVPAAASLTRQEIEHVSGRRHCEALRQAIEPTSIGYGRIDYALLGDRVQIWEINTNPDLLMTETHAPEMLASPYGREVLPRINDAIFGAFRSLDTVAEGEAPIPVDLSVPVA
jgi:hypothetical protein